MKNILTLIIMIFSAPDVFSQETCISGNENNNNILRQLANAKSHTPLTQSIYKIYNLDSVQTEAAYCAECTNSITAPSIAPLELNRNPRAPQLVFKPECLKESNQFDTDTAEVSCPDGTRSKSHNLCINEPFLKYQNAVISSFVSCTIKEGFGGIDMASLFQMFSLESSFKPQYSYNGGIGIGQLTSIFVDDIHQKNRGYGFMKKIAESRSPECEAAKIIATKDLQQKPNIRKPCSFISVGEGLERNILYTLIGFANSWEKDIEPKLRPYINKYPNNPKIDEIKNMTLLNAYGPGGRASARAAIRRLSRLNPDEFAQAMKRPQRTTDGRNLTGYTNKIESRKKQIHEQLPEPIKSQFANVGAKACINTY